MSEMSLNVISQQNSDKELTLFAMCIRASTFILFGSEGLFKNCFKDLALNKLRKTPPNFLEEACGRAVRICNREA